MLLAQAMALIAAAERMYRTQAQRAGASAQRLADEAFHCAPAPPRAAGADATSAPAVSATAPVVTAALRSPPGPQRACPAVGTGRAQPVASPAAPSPAAAPPPLVASPGAAAAALLVSTAAASQPSGGPDVPAADRADDTEGPAAKRRRLNYKTSMVRYDLRDIIAKAEAILATAPSTVGAFNRWRSRRYLASSGYAAAYVLFHLNRAAAEEAHRAGLAMVDTGTAALSATQQRNKFYAEFRKRARAMHIPAGAREALEVFRRTRSGGGGACGSAVAT